MDTTIQMIGMGTFSAFIRDSVPVAGLQNVCVCSTQLDQGINQKGEFCPLNILKRQIEMQMGSVKQESVNLNVK